MNILLFDFIEWQIELQLRDLKLYYRRTRQKENWIGQNDSTFVAAWHRHVRIDFLPTVLGINRSYSSKKIEVF